MSVRQAAWKALVASAIAATSVGCAAWPVEASSAPPITRIGGATVANAATPPPAAPEYGRLRSNGLDAASFAVFWDLDSSQTNLAPSEITIPDAALENSLTDATAAGMRTVVQVMFRCKSCNPQWRGGVHPSDTNAFFDSYRSM